MDAQAEPLGMPRSIPNLQKYLESLTFDTRGQRFNTKESLNEHVELKEKNIPRKIILFV
jgi:hypothetical protein